MPAGAVAGLTDEQLSEAAAFEVEAISEIPQSSAYTSAKRIRIPESEDQFLVTQTNREELHSLIQVLKGNGSKLAGLGHPAGLPDAGAFIDANQDVNNADWRRVEFWDNEVVLVQDISGRLGLTPMGVPPSAN